MSQERLQKVLAHAGVASRRASETLITAGRVTVNGVVVTELGTRVDPYSDDITVDGHLIPSPAPAEAMVYIMLNKPRGILTTVHDDRDRDTVLDIVQIGERVYPVGRLDRHSEGLLLLTNDGDLTHRLTHPRFQAEKAYDVFVEGQVTDETIARWRQGGIKVEGRPVGPAQVKRLRVEDGNTWLEVILTEGRKREIRVVAYTLGHSVKRLIRLRFGPLQLGRLKPGEWRHLRPGEVDQLKDYVKG